ncbi:MAG: hypothetical protein HKN20_18230 [Gemmatimonadetes bacterium]|nr:hypothetical protein [Gemmatimonadota bacterium]
MESGAILNQNTPNEPPCSIRVPIDRDEAYSIVADPENLAGWWFRPGRSLSAPGSKRVHFDADPAQHSVDLRWGEDGDWRHVRVTVDDAERGSRVAISVLPVPGCPTGCLEIEGVRTKRDLKRLKGLLRSRSHLLDSDDYWI